MQQGMNDKAIAFLDARDLDVELASKLGFKSDSRGRWMVSGWRSLTSSTTRW